MKNDEFHIPFIKNLAVVVLVTIVSMVSAHYYLHYRLISSSNTPVYTSHQSQSDSESGK